MADTILQWVGEALRDVAAHEVDRVVVRTNLGTMVLKKPIATSQQAATAGPSPSDYVTKLLAPRVEVYLTRDRNTPALTYTPGVVPNQTLAETGIAGAAVVAFALVGGLSLLRRLV